LASKRHGKEHEQRDGQDAEHLGDDDHRPVVGLEDLDLLGRSL
jgi:hypothetical protein